MGTDLAQTRDLGLSFRPELLNAEYAAWRQDHCSALEHAKNVGKMLCEAKDRLLHGQWKPWLAENFDGSYSTAQVAMQVYGRWQNDPDSLRDADGQLPQSMQGTLTAIRRNRQQRNQSALDALDNAQVDDEESEALYTLTLSQLTSLARQRWHRPPEEPQVLQWLRAEGVAA